MAERKEASADENETRRWKDVAIVLSLIVALAGVITPALMQSSRLEHERRMKDYEVTFLEKRDSYRAFLSQLTDSQDMAWEIGEDLLKPPPRSEAEKGKTVDALFKEHRKLTALSFDLEPFLDAESGKWLSKKIDDSASLLIDIAAVDSNDPSLRDQAFEKYMAIQSEVRGYLYPRLFETEDVASSTRSHPIDSRRPTAKNSDNLSDR